MNPIYLCRKYNQSNQSYTQIPYCSHTRSTWLYICVCMYLKHIHFIKTTRVTSLYKTITAVTLLSYSIHVNSRDINHMGWRGECGWAYQLWTTFGQYKCSRELHRARKLMREPLVMYHVEPKLMLGLREIANPLSHHPNARCIHLLEKYTNHQFVGTIDPAHQAWLESNLRTVIYFYEKHHAILEMFVFYSAGQSFIESYKFFVNLAEGVYSM